MSTRVFDLEGRVGLQDKDFLAKVKRVRDANKAMRREMQIQAGTLKPTKEYQALEKQITQAEKALQDLNKEKEKLAKSHTKSTEYKQLEKDVAAAEAELSRLTNQQQEWAAIGAPHDSKWRELNNQILQAERNVETLKEKLESQGALTEEESKAWAKVTSAIDAAESELSQYNAKKTQMEASGASHESVLPASNVRAVREQIMAVRQAAKGNIFPKKDWDATPISRSIKAVAGQISRVGAIAASVRHPVARVFSGAVNDTKSFFKGLGQIRSGIGGVGKRLTSMLPIQARVGKGFFNISKHANKMKRGLMMGTGIRGLVRLGAAGAIALYSIRMLRQGMENLVNYDATTMNSLNMLKASLDTLRNALATAFAPIFNAVAPALNTLINMLSRAATAVAHFMAAITGQKSVVVAKKAVSGYSGAVGSAAKGTKKATKAAKEYQRTLLGFDQINKLESNKGSDAAGGGGGAGGGAGGVGAGNMFETVPIDSQISAFAERIKKAWKKADFTEIGAILAIKLNTAMANIPWGKINHTAWKIAHSIGTFINGFVETFDWKLLGRTLSNGILVAFTFLSTFLETVHWQSIGKAIVDFISGIRWGALFKASARLLGNIVGAIAGVFAGAAKAVGKKIAGYFRKSMQEAGGNIIKGLFLGIKKAIKGIGKFIMNNIFKPFLKGFKKAFGISSPSKKMKEQGKYLIDGLLDGLKNKFKDVLTWVKDIPDKIKKKIGELGDIGINIVGNIGEIAGEIKDEVTVKFKAVKDTTWDAVTSAYEKIKNSEAVKTLKSAWETGKEAAANAFNAIKDSSAAKTLKSLWARGGAAAANAFNAIKTVKGTLTKKMKATFKAAGQVKTFNKLSAAWNKIRGGTKKFTVKIGASFMSGYNGLARRINKLLGKLPGAIRPGWRLPYFEKGGLYKNGRWHPVQQYESGGLPNQGQMFVAREAGPEMVGTLGGHTAVMNNDQIVASVSAGVARAVAATLAGQSQDVNVYLEGDAGQLFKVVRKEAKNFTVATGLSAFPV